MEPWDHAATESWSPAMTLDARRRRQAAHQQRLDHVHRPATLMRRRRCPIRAGRECSFTTCILPATRAKLTRLHAELFELDHRVDVIVPLWLIIETVVSAALEDPDVVVELVHRRILAALEPEETYATPSYRPG